MDYQPRLDDIQHILTAVLDAPAQLQALSPFAEVDADLVQQVLEEAGKFVASEIAPLQRVGDETGCRFDAGVVTTPPGFRQAYQSFWQAGWPSLACATEDGGQGLPASVRQLNRQAFCPGIEFSVFGGEQETLEGGYHGVSSRFNVPKSERRRLQAATP
jgi:alkylation response protein AidB-like acyl-CoA dehydrogenase